MVRLATIVGPFLLAAFAAEAFPLQAALQTINVRSLAGLGVDAIEDGVKFLGKDGSKAAPSLAKDAHAAAPAAGAAKAGSGPVSSIEKGVGYAACVLRKRAGESSGCGSETAAEAAESDNQAKIEAHKAANRAKTAEQRQADKAQAKADKAAAKAKAKAQEPGAKAAQLGVKDESRKLAVPAPANKDEIPANTKCNSKKGVNDHSQASVLAAQQRGVQLLQLSQSIGKDQRIKGFPHVFTITKGEGIDDVNVPAACKGQQLFEFPILKDHSVFNSAAQNAGTDRVLFTHNAAGQNINCGLITHDTEDTVKNKDGKDVQRFASCK